MRYFFTIWTPVVIVMAIAYFFGFLEWYTPIASFVCCVITQYVYEFYFREKWYGSHGLYSDYTMDYVNELARMQYERIATTQINSDMAVYFYHYWRHWKHEFDVFRIQDILSHCRLRHPNWFSEPQQGGDLSEKVASGQVKSTGKSVSVDDAIARIDDALKRG